MSRIGRLPVAVPQGVKAAVQGDMVVIEGPHGKLQYQPSRRVKVSIEGAKIVVGMTGSDKQSKADYGTTRAHLNNMVQGVSKGWKRSLELSGLGYSAKMDGKRLVLAVGLSHESAFDVPAGIKCSVGKSVIDLESVDKQLLGAFASKVRRVRPPEPYLGKGIKYSGEVIRRKAGKAGKK